MRGSYTVSYVGRYTHNTRGGRTRRHAADTPCTTNLSVTKLSGAAISLTGLSRQFGRTVAVMQTCASHHFARHDIGAGSSWSSLLATSDGPVDASSPVRPSSVALADAVPVTSAGGVRGNGWTAAVAATAMAVSLARRRSDLSSDRSVAPSSDPRS